MSDFDVVVFGSLNIDLISYVDLLPKPGETVHGFKFKSGFGGKGGNQCVSSARLGAKSAMIAKLGDDIWGKSYLENLRKENVDTKYVDICNGATSGMAQISVDKNGQNNIVIVSGANNLLAKEDVDKANDLFLQSKILICQLESPLNATIYALEKFRGQSILNAAPAMADIPQELLKLSSIFCVNETEAQLITGLKFIEIGDAEHMLCKLIEMGANIVVITLGALGAVYASKTDTRMIHVPAQKVENVVDTTGAGDAFIGALAYYLSKSPELPLHKQIDAACKIASYSVQREGTQTSFPTKDQVESNLI